MEGGVDYKQQFELIQLANLALLDQITLLQSHTGVMKDILEVNMPVNLLLIRGLTTRVRASTHLWSTRDHPSF